MEASTICSTIAIGISLLALYQSSLSNKNTQKSDLEKKLTLKANECNKFINSDTRSHTVINQEVSEIFTAIIYAKKQLEMYYRSHWFLLSRRDQKDLVRFFYMELHTSIIELIKNPLNISNYDSSTTPIIEKQRIVCKQFLQPIIDENPSQPK